MADTPGRVAPTLVGTGLTTLLTAGAVGTYDILRSINIVNETANAVTVTMGINTTAADAAGHRLFNAYSIPGNQSVQWTGFLPLLGNASTPDLLYALCSVASGITVVVGYISGP